MMFLHVFNSNFSWMDGACSALGVGIYIPDGWGAVRLYGQGSAGNPEDLGRRVLVVGPTGTFQRPVPRPRQPDADDGSCEYNWFLIIVSPLGQIISLIR